VRLIGLTGAARAGKDTVAGIIAARLGEVQGLAVQRQGFADLLKASAARALGFEGTVAECVAFCDRLKVAGSIFWRDGAGLNDERGALSGREFLQHYGTEAHRDTFGESFWLDAVLPAGRADCDLLLVPDVRFENEAERVIERAGEVWRVVRPGVAAVEAHASEAGLPDRLITREIVNDGDLGALRVKVFAALADYLSSPSPA
jgi:hypothetical protein